MRHLTWTKTTRIFDHADEGKPGTFTWKSASGMTNVETSPGVFAPFTRDDVNKKFRFANCELVLTATGIQIWQEKKLLNTITLNPEIEQNETWARKTATVSNLSITEQDLFFPDGRPRAKRVLNISYRVQTEDMDAEASISLGCGGKVHFGTALTALKSGKQRLAFEIDAPVTPEPRKDRAGNDLPPIRFNFEHGGYWAYTPQETADHVVEVADGKTRIYAQEKEYVSQEKVKVSPDSWGADVGIAANNDDGYDEGGTWLPSGYDNTDYMGKYNTTVNHGGFRWGFGASPPSGTIDTAYIDAYCNVNEGADGNPALVVYAWDTNNAGQFANGGNEPNNVTKTTANVAWTPAYTPAGWRTTGNLAAIVQEILDSYGPLTNEYINFIVWGTGASTWYFICFEDFNAAGTNEAELTITYTAGGGSTTLTAEQGSASITGQAAKLLWHQAVKAEQGSVAITGQAVRLNWYRALKAEQRSVVITGQAARLNWHQALKGEQGAVAITGQDATLTKVTPILTMTAEQGSVAISGQEARLNWEQLIKCEQGSVGITGQDVTLMKVGVGVITITAEQGSVAIAGQAARLNWHQLVKAEQGSVAVTGQAARLNWHQAVKSEHGSVAISGQAVRLQWIHSLKAGQGAIAITGQETWLKWAHLLKAEQGALAITGNDVDLLAYKVLKAGQGSVNIDGQAVTLTYSGTIPTVAPAERTWVVPAENRVMLVASETRRMVIPAENRSVDIGR